MSIEHDLLELRARRYAALGDPIRLKIIDLLTLGDRSPSELLERLDISSNLLAHHLGVLDRAGVIIRSRSEGDKRRSYLRLVTDALDRLEPEPTAVARRVLFVCTGNSARSPLAAALWRRASRIPAASAGTQPAAAAAPKAITTARRHGLDLAGHVPRAVPDVRRPDDLIITVCDLAHEHLAHEHLSAGGLHWSVPNPTRLGTLAAFEAAYDLLAHRVERLAAHLQPTTKGKR